MASKKTVRTKSATRKGAPAPRGKSYSRMLDKEVESLEEVALHLAGAGGGTGGPGGPLFVDMARLAVLYDMAAPMSGETIEHAISSTLVLMIATAKASRSGYEFRAEMARTLEAAAGCYMTQRLEEMPAHKAHPPSESVLFAETTK